MVVANWGIKIIFVVSPERVFTYRNFEQTITARWVEHQILYEKGRAEFLGPDISEIKMEAVLNAQLGISPSAVKANVERACQNGETAYIFVGGEKVGKHKWYLNDFTSSPSLFYKDGKVLRNTLQLTFREYVEKE